MTLPSHAMSYVDEPFTASLKGMHYMLLWVAIGAAQIKGVLTSCVPHILIAAG